MSISASRLARKGLRRTPVSGKVVPADNVCLPSWHEIVADSIPVETKLERVKRQKEREAKESTVAAARKIEYPFSGNNRAERRKRLKGTGFLGSYTRELETTLGKAWSESLEAGRAMRHAPERPHRQAAWPVPEGWPKRHE